MPNIDRRAFLRAAGGLTIAGIGSRFGTASGLELSRALPDPWGVRVGVLAEPGFPGIDHLAMSSGTLTGALTGMPVSFFTAAEAAAKLENIDVFVNPWGSAFPVDCWPAIRAFLAGGGSFVNLGGSPFSIPVRSSGSRGAAGLTGQAAWHPEVPQASYQKSLGITAAFEVPLPPGSAMRGDEEIARGISASRAHALYFRFTSTRDYPQEDGTSGQRDASVRAVVGAQNREGDMIAAPVVELNRLLGEFAGGRWILAAYSGSISADAVRALVLTAARPPVSSSVVPSFAAYLPGEIPSIRFRADDVRGTRRSEDGGFTGRWRLSVSGEGFSHSDDVEGPSWVMPQGPARKLKPGLYSVEAEYRHPGGSRSSSFTVKSRNAFWIRDEKLLGRLSPIEVRGNAFYRNGKPFPVAGTSYMSDDVQRKFLFEPNPAGWDEDFRQMRAAGINMIRTGIWTGWKNVMLDAGSLAEYPLRSLDAFLLTASKHDIPVIFTFFAFLPEAWGGANPYMDPRAVQAQKTFLTAIASRYRGMPGVIWDLINEPSFSSPSQLWYCRPNYDRYERDAWSAWISAQVPAADSASAAGIIRERFRLTEGEAPALPPPEDFAAMNLIGSRRPVRAGEYRLFAQEMFRDWTKEMAGTLRSAGNGRQLVTVGQDEGGTYERPGPHFFAPEVDFTSMHNWWHNDDLLWDSLMTTVTGKPNLIQETGVMFYENPDGRPWRTEEETRNLLERKLGISFGAGGAGFINWLWNSNPYMDSDNEAGIGLKRADGSVKPEFGVVREYARFFSRHAGRFGERVEEDAVLVIPHSNMFAARSVATEATKNAVRILEYLCRIPLRTVSEYALPPASAPPVLLILPSPVMVDRKAWDALTALVAAGSTLAVSGPFELDRHLIPAGRAAALGKEGSVVPVGTEEHLLVDGIERRLGFRGDRLQRVEKFSAAGAGPVPGVIVIPSGKGKIVWSPLPVELSDAPETAAAFFRYAAKSAGLRTALSFDSEDPSVLVRPVVHRASILLACVSEASMDRTVSGTLTESGAHFTVTVPARRTLMRLLDRGTGNLIDELNPALKSAAGEAPAAGADGEGGGR